MGASEREEDHGTMLTSERSIIIYFYQIFITCIYYIYITCTYVIYLLHVHVIYIYYMHICYVIYSLHVHMSSYNYYIVRYMSLLIKQKKL